MIQKRKGNKSKQKGNSYERELVKQFKAAGIKARRAWGSNGNALGEHEEVDLVVNYWRETSSLEAHYTLKLQAKRRKKFPKVFGLTVNVDAAVFRENHGETYILLRLKDFIKRFLNNA